MAITASHALQARSTPAVSHVQRMRAGRTQVMLRRSSFRPEVKLAVRAFRPSAGRLSIATEANLFSRLFRIARSTINSLVNQVEDPERLLDQVVQDMNDDVIRMRQASASALGSSKQLEKKYLSAQKAADEWFRRAEMAVQQGSEDLAREALARKKAFQKQADQLREQYTAQKQAVDSLVTNTRAIERKLDEARSKKETLKARAASAKSAKAVQEMVGSLDTSSAVAAFDKMEQKVMALEAEAESIGQLVAPDDIEQQFRKLEGLSVEDELEKMKRGVLADKGQSKLPQGRPIKDAIDLEIETIRLRNRE